MTRVLIAGGAGFLGSHLTERLLKEGYEVIVVDDLSSGLESNLSQVIDQIELIKYNITDLDYKKPFDILINLASRASRVEWETYPVEVALSNSVGNNNLIKLALRNKALYIYASSSEVYGNPDLVPTPETYLGRVSTTGTRSPYDEGKRFGEALVKSYEREYGLKNIIIRFFNTYGPRMRGGDFYGRVMDRFIQQAINREPITVYGDGCQTRSFTYVSDCIEAVSILIKKGIIGEIYNVGNDTETRILGLAKLVKKVSNSDSEIVFLPLPVDDPVRRSADITKLRNLNFYHRVSMEDGIRITVQKSWPSRI